MARGIRRALLISPPEDPQRELVYLWENHNFRTLFYGPSMSLAEARKTARAMARFCRIPAPVVGYSRLGKKGNTAEQRGRRLWVNKDKAGWTHALLAHEMAHWACDRHYGPAVVQDHGPSWMNIYLQLLDKFKVLPLHASRHSARRFKIKVAK